MEKMSGRENRKGHIHHRSDLTLMTCQVFVRPDLIDMSVGLDSPLWQVKYYIEYFQMVALEQDS